MEEEEAFGMFGWAKMLEEGDEHEEQRCPNCGSKRVRFEKGSRVWRCLQCGFEFEK